jgi:hypothetical protein
VAAVLSELFRPVLRLLFWSRKRLAAVIAILLLVTVLAVRLLTGGHGHAQPPAPAPAVTASWQAGQGG